MPADHKIEYSIVYFQIYGGPEKTMVLQRRLISHGHLVLKTLLVLQSLYSDFSGLDVASDCNTRSVAM